MFNLLCYHPWLKSRFSNRTETRSTQPRIPVQVQQPLDTIELTRQGGEQRLSSDSQVPASEARNSSRTGITPKPRPFKIRPKANHVITQKTGPIGRRSRYQAENSSTTNLSLTLSQIEHAMKDSKFVA